MGGGKVGSFLAIALGFLLSVGRKTPPNDEKVSG